MKKLILDFGNINKFFILKDEKLLDIFVEKSYSKNIVGNIYYGIVTNVIKNLFCFVKFDKDKIGMISIKKSNSEFIVGKKILVQVKKMPQNNKNFTLTTNISILNENFILKKDNKNEICFSQKISLENKNILKNWIEKINLENFSVLIRTNAKNFLQEDLTKNLYDFIEYFKNILCKLKSDYDYHYENNYYLKQFFNQDFDKIIHNDLDKFKKYRVFFSENTKIIFDCNKSDINFFYCENILRNLLSRKVWVKSGAYFIVDELEALTAFDINSGKNIIYNEEIFLNINLEVTKEILNHIKFRNISGIIFIDIIKFKNAEHKNFFIEEIKAYNRKEKFDIDILGFTNLGLLELNRERKTSSISKIIFGGKENESSNFFGK